MPPVPRRVSPSYSHMQPIMLYDIGGGPTQSWAPNICRIRCMLNFKRLPFKTICLEPRDVENQLRSIGAPPTSYRHDRTPVYALPVLVDPNRSGGAYGHSHGHGNGYHPSQHGMILSNANIIADYLEATYPARPVFPEGSRAMQTLVVHYIQDVFIKPLLPIMLPLSRGYSSGGSGGHHLTNGVNGGSSHHGQLDDQWRQVKGQFDFLATILEKNLSDQTGTFIQGKDVTYADLALCSVLAWIRKVAPRDCWLQVKTWNGNRWGRLYDRCREYIED